MTDLYMDPATKDIWISPTGATRLTATLLEETTQRLDTRLRFFLGEWKLNKIAGVPFFRDVFVKNPNMPAIQAVFAAEIQKDPAVANLDSITVTLDAARQLAVVFSATLTDGSVIPSTTLLP